MAIRAELHFKEGPIAGRVIAFEGHDTLVFGRGAEGAANLPPDDTSASRNHFFIEAIPPALRIRDLGSLNGTFVNDVCIGMRAEGESPEQGAAAPHPDVELKHGDRVRAGGHVMGVEVTCTECHQPLQATDRVCPACSTRRSAHAPKKDDDIGELLALLWDAAKAPESAPAPSVVVGHEIVRELGTGATAVVYEARRTSDRASRALKLLKPEHEIDEEAVKRFLREIKLMAKLDHPNIVQFHEGGEAGGVFWLSLEYCDGGTLSRYLADRGGKLPWREAVGFIVQALAGLEAAHAKSIVHRDIKPANLLISRKTTVKVADFGLAKAQDASGMSSYTMAGMVAGTPWYMPREQATSLKEAGPVSDVYAMASSLYHLITGHVPRDFSRSTEWMNVVLDEHAIPIRKREPDLPKQVAAPIDAALALDAKKRTQTAATLKNALFAALEDPRLR